MQGTCPEIVPSRTGREKFTEVFKSGVVSRLDPRTFVSSVKMRRLEVKTRAKAEAYHISVSSVVMCVTAVLLLVAAALIMQFAGLVETQYELNRQEAKLAYLRHAQAELRNELSTMASLKHVEAQAKKQGMVYPSEVLVVTAPGCMVPQRVVLKSAE